MRYGMMLALMGVLAANAYAAVVDVTTFGADKTGTRATEKEINAAVRSAKPGDVIFFPKGTYHLDHAIWVGCKTNVVLRGEAGTLIRMHCNPCGAESESSGGFTLYRCADVAVEHFHVTTDNPIGCVGRVTSVDLKASTVDMRIDAPFPVTGAEHFFQLNTCDDEGTPDGAIEVHHPITPRTNATGRVTYEGFSYRVTGDHCVKIQLPGYSLQAITNAHRMLIRYFREGTGPLILNAVTRGRIEDFEVERTPSTGCVIVPPSHDLVFKGFSIRMKEGDPHVCASNSDGIHFIGCSGSVRLENCHFKGLGDDALNVHSLGGEVKSFDPATGTYEFIRRTIRQEEREISDGWATAGDVIAVYDPKTMAKRGTVTLETFCRGKGKIRDVRGSGVLPRPGDFLANEKNYPDVYITGCSVENTRARAFLLQTKKAVIERCRFRGLKSAAVLIACDMVFWHEMGPFEDVTIRGCTFEKCAKRLRKGDHHLAALAIRAQHNGGMTSYPAGVHHNLRIENNAFKDVGTSAIFVEATDGVLIRGNRFEDWAQDQDLPPEMREPVRLHNCRNVRQLDNQAMPAKGSKDAKRPYEMVFAQRRQDEVPPVDRLESATGWTARGERSEAKVTSANDRLLFGDGTLRLDYRALTNEPIVHVVRTEPLKLPPFDTFSVWIYGNNFYGRAPADTPITQLSADFADASGKPFSLHLATILHREWCKFQVKVPADRLARAMKGGCTFRGFTLTGGRNREMRRLDFTSLCAFVEKFPPLRFAPRPKRGIQIFPDQPQGANTGDGKLSFPTVATTVIPPCSKEDRALDFRTPANPGNWDDLAFRIGDGEWIPLALGGGVWPRSAADKAEVHWFRHGNSIVADITVKGGDVEDVRFGGVGIDVDSATYPIPFYRYGLGGWDERPQVAVAAVKGGTRFISATLDWTQSGCSEPYPPLMDGEAGVAINGGARYLKKTDGTRNDVYERFVWTVSPKFEETLPYIPNPVSPWKHVTGRNAWTTSGASRDRTPNLNTMRDYHRKGMRHLMVTDHESGWRDGDESFTFRTMTAPGRGGDRSQYEYARQLIDVLGYWYGPYNNFTDYAPVNGNWHSDYVGRRSDGNWHPAWSRCTGPKPLYAVAMCEKLAPIIQEKFRFNTAYCDVHTAVSPWSRTDYDARLPGAGTFAQTFYAYGEIMEIQKRTWKGPVSSEGGHQWMYSGITDQNYGQDCPYQLMHHPWIVDFDLLRMHPLTCDHGMGFAGMLFGDANVPKGSPWLVVEPWTTATFAFGHTAFLLPENPTYAYYMVLAPASRYSQETACAIRYADEAGRWHTTSEAILSGDIARNRISVLYSAGTRVIVNGDREGGRFVLPQEDGRVLILPQWGFLVRGGEVIAYSGPAKDGTNRVDFCRGSRADGYVYLHGRGTLTAFPGGLTDGEMVRLAETNGTEEIFVPGSSQAELGLPYAATRLVGLSYDTRKIVKEIPFRIDERGWTRFKRQPGCFSYRATLPSNFTEPSADAYADWTLRPAASVAVFGSVPLRAARKTHLLPRRYRKGILTPDGRETPLVNTCGGYCHTGGATCGGISRQGMTMHPPYQNGFTGAAFARFTLTVPASAHVFQTDIGKMDHSTPGDGVLFKVGVRTSKDAPLKILKEQRVTAWQWQGMAVDLAEYAGKKVEFYLITDPGGNTYGDGGAWFGMHFRK